MNDRECLRTPTNVWRSFRDHCDWWRIAFVSPFALYSPLSGEFAANIFFDIRKDIRYSVRAALKLNIRQYPPRTLSHCTTFYNIPVIIIFDPELRQKRYSEHEKYLNQQCRNISALALNHQVLAAAKPTCPAYVDGRKRENSSF